MTKNIKSEKMNYQQIETVAGRSTVKELTAETSQKYERNSGIAAEKCPLWSHVGIIELHMYGRPE